jgi:hypothetical protein
MPPDWPPIIQIMGLVRAGKLVPFDQKSEIELTTTGIVDGRGPDPLDLTKYEGKVIMVRGMLQGATMYRAEVIDEAGPILTAIVLELFGKRSKS